MCSSGAAAECEKQRGGGLCSGAHSSKHRKDKGKQEVEGRLTACCFYTNQQCSHLTPPHGKMFYIYISVENVLSFEKVFLPLPAHFLLEM